MWHDRYHVVTVSRCHDVTRMSRAGPAPPLWEHAPHRTAPHRTARHRTAPHRTALLPVSSLFVPSYEHMSTIVWLIWYFTKVFNPLARTTLSSFLFPSPGLPRSASFRYLEESLATMLIPPEPPEQAGRSLYERLQIADMKAQLLRRVKDLVKNLSGSRHELDVLQDMSRIVTTKKTAQTQESIETGMKTLILLQEANAQASQSLELVTVILSGSLAFDVMDRVTGEWTVVNTLWMRDFVEPMIRNTPVVWLMVNMLFWVFIAIIIKKLMRRTTYISQGVITLQMTHQVPINVEALNTYVSARSSKIVFEKRDYEIDNDIVKLSWEEKDKRDWGGSAPTVEVEYDEKFSFMLKIIVSYQKRKAKKTLAFNAQELKVRIMQDFKAANIFIDDDDEEGDGAGDVDFG